jgi:hypothetical protein
MEKQAQQRTNILQGTVDIDGSRGACHVADRGGQLRCDGGKSETGADLDRELQSDLELEEEEQRERGLSEEDARYAALRVFGNTTVIREQTRHVWGWTYIECLWQDIHFALRQISHNKRFAAICILTLALGIGTQATIYSVIHAVLVNPYPYRGASRMVHIHLYDKEPAPYDLALDGPQFDLFAKSPVLDGAIANVGDTLALTGGELPVQLQVGRMSGNAFAYFGVPALLWARLRTIRRC